MLSVLRIENLALVESLTWEMSDGLTAVTGETGAGKSIIVGALRLLLGERSDRSLIRSGAERCLVEGVFHLPDPGAVDALLAEAGLPPCEENQLVVRRVVSTSGANRQFLNCAPATLGLVRGIGGHLVDLHGPSAHQSLVSPERQLEMLDAFAHASGERAAYQEAYAAWRECIAEREAFDQADSLDEQQIDLLRHQLEEIRAADLRPDEETELLARFHVTANAAALIDTAGRIGACLDGDAGSVLDRLREVQRLVRDLEELDPAVRDWSGSFDSAQVELEDFAQSAGRYAAGLDADPALHRELEARVDLLESLKRKYGGTLAAVADHAGSVEAKLAGLGNREESLARLDAAVASARETLDRRGADLSRLRRSAAPRLARAVVGHLRDLGFRQSRIDLDLPSHPSPAAHGLESADFIFAPNPGEPPQPLRLIASSGEMSRVMLAVKSALAEVDRTPLLVFDEIDANVGGEIARAVGAKMADLGRSHQVIAITHLPQVAALARSHFLVEKGVAEGRTRSGLRPVADTDRVEEIARMLGGQSESALLHATTLLQSRPS